MMMTHFATVDWKDDLKQRSERRSEHRPKRVRFSKPLVTAVYVLPPKSLSATGK